MQKNGAWLVCGAVLAVLVFACGQDAQARPKYMGAFNEAYPALKAQADTVKCNACHFGEKKSNRNDYGMAVGKSLGEKNLMDAEKIKEGLKKAEVEKNPDGKTFGAVNLVEGASANLLYTTIAANNGPFAVIDCIDWTGELAPINSALADAGALFGPSCTPDLDGTYTSAPDDPNPYSAFGGTHRRLHPGTGSGSHR